MLFLDLFFAMIFGLDLPLDWHATRGLIPNSWVCFLAGAKPPQPPYFLSFSYHLLIWLGKYLFGCFQRSFFFAIFASMLRKTGWAISDEHIVFS